MLLKIIQITSTWVHELELMAQLEGEFVNGRSCFVNVILCHLFLLFKGTNGFTL